MSMSLKQLNTNRRIQISSCEKISRVVPMANKSKKFKIIYLNVTFPKHRIICFPDDIRLFVHIRSVYANRPDNPHVPMEHRL